MMGELMLSLDPFDRMESARGSGKPVLGFTARNPMSVSP